MEKYYYAYKEFKKDTRVLKSKVLGFDAEAIVAIARGGYAVAQALAEGLDIRNLQSIRTELYDDDRKRENITILGTCTFENIKKVLVVDDIADSGETLAHVMEYFQNNYPDVEFQSATLFYKKSSVYEPTYWVQEANVWIDFFWERDFL